MQPRKLRSKVQNPFELWRFHSSASEDLHLCCRLPSSTGIPEGTNDATRWSRQLCFSRILWEHSSQVQAMSCLQSLSQNLHHPPNEKHFYYSFVSSFATKIKGMQGRVRDTTKLQASFHFQLGVTSPSASWVLSTNSHQSLELL